MNSDKLDFNDVNPLLSEWIPTDIEISRKEYENRSKICEKCLKDVKKYGFCKYTLDTDIFFDLYYWINPQSLENKYALNYSEYELCKFFDCNPKELLDKAKHIGMYDLVLLGTYHSLWLHYYIHEMYKLQSGKMVTWDSMYQAMHVEVKNCINYLVYLLLNSPERKFLMEEIRHFSICPPEREKGICGYEYKQLKTNWETNIIKFDLVKDYE